MKESVALTLFFDQRRFYGTSIKVARIFNTHGPRMLENDGRVASNFIVQALREEPITRYGDGRQTRSFCYIDDLLTGLELLMESGPDVTGQCNLGNPHEVPVRDIAHMVLGHTGSRSRIVHRPLPQDDPKRRQPVIALAQQVLGWRPRVALEQGLRATIDYFLLRLFTPGIEPRALPIELAKGCSPKRRRGERSLSSRRRCRGRTKLVELAGIWLNHGAHDSIAFAGRRLERRTVE
jgi:UDP-glucuronate decarboxylase